MNAPGTDSEVQIRPAAEGDAVAIAEIHSGGIEDRVATFQDEPQGADSAAARMERGPVLVAERGGAVVGWAGIGPYEHYTYFEGIGEVTVYVDRLLRGGGVGGRLLEALSAEGERQGRYKLLAKIFSTNEASLRMFERSGFRTVGTHRRHGRLDGGWRDVVVVEKLLGDAAAGV